MFGCTLSVKGCTNKGAKMNRKQKERLDCLNKKIEIGQGLTEQEYRELEKLQALERLEQAKKADRHATFSLCLSTFTLIFAICVFIWKIFIA